MAKTAAQALAEVKQLLADLDVEHELTPECQDDRCNFCIMIMALEACAEYDEVDVAQQLARHFKPHGTPTYSVGRRGRQEINPPALWDPATGSESTMIVFNDIDGHNSMRALSFDEIGKALYDLGLL